MRPSADAEAAALRWEESVACDECAGEPRTPVRRPREPTRSAIADGAAIRWLERQSDGDDATLDRAA
jgi:hypothetical protein